MVLTEEMAERYSRHFVLKEIGVSGQKKLLQAKVLVIGAGGLGSAALMYLAAAGTGVVGIADFDKVSLSNLQRQVIHSSGDVGIDKTLSAEKFISRLNPDVRVILHNAKMTVDNIQSVISGYDFILDCTDSFESKFLINDACVLSNKPYSHAGIVRFEGQIMTYVPGKGPCLRCLLGGVPPRDGSISCSSAGVLGAAAGVMGSLQAIEAVKYILGIGDLLVGRILRFDALKMQFSEFDFPKSDSGCAVCGANPKIRSLADNRAEYEGTGCM